MKKRAEPFEGSEEERFLKSLAKCRNCGHVKMAHYFLGISKKCVDSRLDVKGEYKQCTCKNYEPKDNLEFLEWKYKKKLGKKK